MSEITRRAAENVTGLVSLLILGAGFVALAAGWRYFWLVWVLGFAVLLPIVGVLAGEGDSGDESVGGDEGEDEPADALDALRTRYARGELDEEQFERRLEALLETETPEGARDRIERERAERADREADRER